MYVVLKSEGQSNQLIMITIIIIMMIMMVTVMVMIMIMMTIMTMTIMIMIMILCLPSAVFIALMLVQPSKCLKQIIQMKLNRVKNPNWPEGALAILQAWSTI